MSEEKTGEAAARLLNDGTDLWGMSDAEIRRHVVIEMLDADDDISDEYANGAFSILRDGDPRMAQGRRAQRRRRIAALVAAPVAGRRPN